MEIRQISNHSSNLPRSGTMRKMHEFYINDNDKNKESYSHKDNSIDTTKYNIFTFLPKALLFQFARLANCYFLIIAIIQCIPEISPLSSTTAIVPIAFVLCVSIIREGIEDYARYQYDKILNNEEVFVFRKEFVKTTSGSLKIGEIILVKENDPLPADIILLDSNIKEGIAFIQTGTLDGENAPKQKITNCATANFFKQNGSFEEEPIPIESFNATGNFICDPPNSDLYKIEGNLDIKLFNNSTNQKLSFKIPIEAKQLLLKGAILKNTKWIIGFVAYTGSNTKLILNSKKPRMKFSRVESLMQKMLIFILFLQMIFCIVCAILNSVYYENVVIMNPYVPPPLRDSPVYDSALSYFTYMLLLNTMIPISLIISLEIVKLIQGYFTRVDVLLYSHVREKFSKAGSISLNEELGQVNFIFSDKTGTLTCNKMLFKYCVIGDVCYEYSKNYKNNYDKDNYHTNTNNLNAHKFMDEDSKLREENNIKMFGPYSMLEMANSNHKEQHFVTSNNNLQPSNLKNNFNLGNLNNYNTSAPSRSRYPEFILKSQTDPSTVHKLDEENLLVNEFWKILSLAHECDCNDKKEDDEQVEYIGMSPDDIELVKSAREQGYEFLKSNSQETRTLKIGREVKNFKVLKVMEFSSDRKRMSILFRDVDDGGKIKLYMKGADSEIKKKLCKSSRTDFMDTATNYVDLFSAKGYRTLLLGMKIIDEKYYLEWKERMDKAELDLNNKKESVEKCYDEIENGIYLLGATVVEDKLQDQVPETIRDLRLAGIKIWMLTGDKMNTAFNIGLSCNLISKAIKTFSVSGEKGESLEKLIKEFMKFCQDFNNMNNGNMDEKDSHISPTPTHPFSIIIDAVALAMILKSKESVKMFLDIASQSVSVICCRVSPLQKSEVVNIMKKYNPKAVTLSIGDGGNDVSMIMEAHIGIGVYGEEGMRAVQASDFAIGEFKFLRRLLMFHGRTNNIRISEMILYFFFKNFVFTILHFYYAFYNNFSGQTIIDDWFISLYNLIFTSLPLGVRACSDFDVTPDDGIVVEKMMPFLYKENRDFPIFTKSSFLLSLIRGIIYGIINFFIILISLDESSVDSNGNLADLWYISANLFTGIIFIASFKLINVQKHFVWMTPVIIFVTSWLAYFAFVAYVHFSDTFNSYATMGTVFGSAKFYLTLLLCIGFTSMLDKALYAFSILFSNQIFGFLMVERKIQGQLNDMNIMPETIINLYKKYSSYDVKDGAGAVDYSLIKNANEKDISKIDRISEDIINVNEKNSYIKSITENSAKLNMNQDLLMKMEAPYKKKVSAHLERKWNEIEKIVNSKKNKYESEKQLNDIGKDGGSSYFKDKDKNLSQSNNNLISHDKDKENNLFQQLYKTDPELNGPVINKLTHGNHKLVMKDSPEDSYNDND